MSPESRRPLIFDIHRYALDDGPGIRTTVFFKGCPLACLWCHNPESLDPGPELYYQVQRCIACGDCAAACPEGAVKVNAQAGHAMIDRNRCNACGACAVQCPTKALSIKGRYYTVDELVEHLLQDRRFFENSGGGVTFSGGEPTLHTRYLHRAMVELKRHDIHIALQTCGLFEWGAFERELLPYIDAVYFDLKSIDSRRHHRWTGRSNHRILNNLKRLTDAAKEKLTCSIPLIDGFTAESKNIRDVALKIGAIAELPYRLHPYHPGTHTKSAALGKPVSPDLPLHSMTPETYLQIAHIFDTLVCHHRQR